LQEQGIVGESELQRLDTEIEVEMNEAIEHAIAAEFPAETAMFHDVYAKGEPEPRPVRALLSRILGEVA
jgi:TPP-dependent pyruvate/acetoin dehydrogenase alpha subunit